METIAEFKKSHIWRKIVWRTDDDLHPLGPHHHAEVYCCEETNGFTVWYVRRLAKEDKLGNPDTANGDYLISYFAKNKRDEAIEHAVLIANAAATPEAVLLSLDELSKSAQRV